LGSRTLPVIQKAHCPEEVMEAKTAVSVNDYNENYVYRIKTKLIQWSRIHTEKTKIYFSTRETLDYNESSSKYSIVSNSKL
jgi:hypothetical protein